MITHHPISVWVLCKYLPRRSASGTHNDDCAVVQLMWHKEGKKKEGREEGGRGGPPRLLHEIDPQIFKPLMVACTMELDKIGGLLGKMNNLEELS